MSHEIKPAYAAVNCEIHGRVTITGQEYDRQMDSPDNSWICPICHNFAAFDDEFFDELHGEED